MSDGVTLEQPPFATIQVGRAKTPEEFRQSVRDSGVGISDWANSLIARPGFKLVLEPADIALCSATSAELGRAVGQDYQNGCTVRQSLEQIGAIKVPHEAAGEYLRQYPSGLKPGDWLLMYMELIFDSGGAPGVFLVGRDEGGLWLDAYYADPGYFYRGYGVWVFAR